MPLLSFSDCFTLVTMDDKTTTISRFKTAIRRHDLSRPMKCALADGLISQTSSVFDYGCGHGEDIESLNAQGIVCNGWDPTFRPYQSLRTAHVVNLGYVVNVIEDPLERASTLQTAWGLCEQVLIVSALVRIPGRGNAFTEFGDGVLTSRGTFQKFYGQSELREFLETELRVEAIPATLGVFYVFKDDLLRQTFLASRYRRRSAVPRQLVSQKRFSENEEILTSLMEAVAQLGRLPDADEFPQTTVIEERLGSLKRAFALIKRVTGGEKWLEIRQRRMDDLQIFLALTRFKKRPKLSNYPKTLQRDIRAFFSTYNRACEEADSLLFSVGIAEKIDAACKESKIGKLLPNALYVHRSAVDQLAPILRVYDGCARAYLGEIEDANLIKLHRYSGKISYLVYPDFDTDPHPSLQRSYKLSLRTRELECLDYTTSDNPPILHRKETFVAEDHPQHDLFAALTRQEEEYGLLSDTSTIGTKQGWLRHLDETGVIIQGHCVKPASSSVS